MKQKVTYYFFSCSIFVSPDRKRNKEQLSLKTLLLTLIYSEYFFYNIFFDKKTEE